MAKYDTGMTPVLPFPCTVNTVLLAALEAQLLTQFGAFFLAELVLGCRRAALHRRYLTLGNQRSAQRGTPLVGLVRRRLFACLRGRAFHRHAMALGQRCWNSQAGKAKQDECFEHS